MMGSLKNIKINLATFFSLKDRKLSIEKAYTEGIYADTPANRKLGRVGMSYAEYEKKTGKGEKQEENISTISVYRLGKHFEKENLTPRIVDKKEFFQVSFDKDEFTKENISKTKEIIEKLGGSITPSSSSSHFIRVYKSKTPTDTVEEDIFKIGDYRVDTINQTLIHKNGEKESLTPKECDLLKLFAANPNKFISRDEVLEKVWGEANYYNSRSLDVYINRLRNKLAKDKDVDIMTVYWKGFKLKLPSKKVDTKFTESDAINDIIGQTTTLKNIGGKKLDAIISYSNSIEGVDGIKVREGATEKEKRQAIASFYIKTAELEGADRGIASDLDSIIEDALEDYVPSKKEKKEEIKKEEKKEEKKVGNKEVLKKINDHFGFEDEEASWFADTPIALTMANDKEFSDIIDNFTEYQVLSQSGGYKNDGSRKTMLECDVTYEIVPKGTLDEDIEISKKEFTIDSKTTIRDILSKLGQNI